MTAKHYSQTALAKANRHLEAFGDRAPGLSAAVLLSSDGFELASLKVAEDSASRLAAMGSSLAAIGSAIAGEAGLTECNRLIVESESGVIAVSRVSGARPPLVLVVVVNDSETLGKLIWATGDCCKALEKVFGA